MSRTLTYKGNGYVFPVDDNLVCTTCWCGIRLAIPENLYDFAQVSDPGKVAIHCPLGHEFVYNNNRLGKERERAERAERRATAERELREHTEHKLRAQKGATTKARKRHAAGVCPCCRRTFQNVRRHMSTQHPDYDPARDDG